MEENSRAKIKALEAKIKELEKSVGQKQIKLVFLEKMIEIADEKFDIDIIKKQSPKPSTTSKKTKKS